MAATEFCGMSFLDRLKAKTGATPKGAPKERPEKKPRNSFSNVVLPSAMPSRPRPSTPLTGTNGVPAWHRPIFTSPANIDDLRLMNRKVWVEAAELLERVPAEFRTTAPLPNNHRIYFHLNEVAVRIAQGHSTVPLGLLVSACPELLDIETLKGTKEPVEIAFPWHAIVDQVRAMRLSPDVGLEPAKKAPAAGVPSPSKPEAAAPVPAIASPLDSESEEEVRAALLAEIEDLRQKNWRLDTDRQSAINELLAGQAAWRKRGEELTADRDRLIHDREALVRQVARIRAERDNALHLLPAALAKLEENAQLPAEARLEILTDYLMIQVHGPDYASRSHPAEPPRESDSD